MMAADTAAYVLSNTVLMHRALRRANIAAEFHIWEAMGHSGFFGMATEDREVLEEQVRFIRQYL